MCPCVLQTAKPLILRSILYNITLTPVVLRRSIRLKEEFVVIGLKPMTFRWWLHILATTGPPPLNYLEPKWVPAMPMTCLRFAWPIPNIGSFYSTGSSDGKPDHGDGKLHQSRHLPLRQLRPLLRRAARKVRPGNPAAVGGKDISSKRTSMRQLTEGDAQLTAAGPLGACTKENN